MTKVAAGRMTKVAAGRMTKMAAGLRFQLFCLSTECLQVANSTWGFQGLGV